MPGCASQCIQAYQVSVQPTCIQQCMPSCAPKCVQVSCRKGFKCHCDFRLIRCKFSQLAFNSACQVAIINASKLILSKSNNVILLVCQLVTLFAFPKSNFAHNNVVRCVRRHVSSNTLPFQFLFSLLVFNNACQIVLLNVLKLTKWQFKKHVYLLVCRRVCHLVRHLQVSSSWNWNLWSPKLPRKFFKKHGRIYHINLFKFCS